MLSMDVTQLHLKQEKARNPSMKLACFPGNGDSFKQNGNCYYVSKISEQDFKFLERFFVFLYSHACNTDDMNIAHRMLFTHGNCSIENIPPTAGALKQHVLRAALQAWRWRQCLQLQRADTDPTAWDGLNVGTNTYLYGVSCQKLQQHEES